MAILTKTIDGNIYIDEFDIQNPNWIITPSNDRVLFDNGIAKLQHGDSKVSMLTNVPNGNFVMQAKIKHEPIILYDIGGVVLFTDIDNNIEYQTYYNSDLGLNQYYTYFKIEKLNDVYTSYFSKNGILWELIGSSQLSEVSKIGFFLYGDDAINMKDFEIYNLYIYKSNYINFYNIPINYSVQIINNETNTLIKEQIKLIENDVLTINMTNFIFPLLNHKIVIKNELYETVVELDEVSLYGGDCFDYSYNIKIYINNTLINPLEEFDLGDIGFEKEFNIMILNNDNNIFTNRIIAIKEYGILYENSDFVKLSLDNNGPIEYLEELLLPDIQPNESLSIWMKVNRKNIGNVSFFVNNYKYKLIIK